MRMMRRSKAIEERRRGAPQAGSPYTLGEDQGLVIGALDDDLADLVVLPSAGSLDRLGCHSAGEAQDDLIPLSEEDSGEHHLLEF